MYQNNAFCIKVDHQEHHICN